MHACTQATTALNSPVPFSDDPNILPKEQVPPPLADSMSAVAAMGNVSAAQMMQVGGCLGDGWWVLRVLSAPGSGVSRLVCSLYATILCPVRHVIADF